MSGHVTVAHDSGDTLKVWKACNQPISLFPRSCDGRATSLTLGNFGESAEASVDAGMLYFTVDKVANRALEVLKRGRIVLCWMFGVERLLWVEALC